MSFWAGAALIMVGAAIWNGNAQSRLPYRSTRSRAIELLQGLRRRVMAHWRRSQRLSRRRSSAAAFVVALADELATGLPATTALQRAGEERGLAREALGAARVGGDVAAALRRDAAKEGLPLLAALAAVWQVSAGSGAGLAAAARRLGAGAVEQERQRRELAAQMSGPRSTARVLAVLPVVGLLLGSGFGGSPLGWLFGTPIGWLVLIAGITLEVLGVLWVRWLIRRVERQL